MLACRFPAVEHHAAILTPIVFRIEGAIMRAGYMGLTGLMLELATGILLRLHRTIATKYLDNQLILNENGDTIRHRHFSF